MKKLLGLSFALLLIVVGINESNAAFPVKKAIHSSQIQSKIEKNTETVSAVQENQLANNESATASNSSGGKSQLIALILCIALGGLGIHRFYLGYIWQGIVQLLTLGGCGIWALIDLIRIITGSLQPKDGDYDKTL